MLNLLRLHLTELLFPKFTPFDLASDGFGQLRNKLHLGEERANHPESCCHFLPVPTPLFTLHVPKQAAAGGGLNGGGQVRQVLLLSPWSCCSL